MKSNITHIVVDADIGRSAGLSEHPVSSSSRNTLLKILDSGFPVAFCPILLNEWKKHRSIFATRWLSAMIARKRIYRITPNARSAEEVENSRLTEKQKGIAAKDAHVVDLAISTGNFIASNDKAAREVFCILAGGSVLLNGLIWAVPIDCVDVLSEVLEKRSDIPDGWRIRTH